MFFILSKIFIYFLYPFTWFIICLAGFFFTKNGKWKKRFKIATVSIFLLCSNTVLFLEVMKRWEIHGTLAKNVKKYDVAIVLGGMFSYNSDLQTLTVQAHADRIWQAITLYKKGKIKKILISGGSGYVSGRGLKEAKQLKEVLTLWGIPGIDIITEESSRNTHENALETQNILNRSYPHLNKKLLITSGFHMRRAKACFEKVGLSCDTFSTDLITGPRSNYFWDQYLVPDMSTLFGWNRLIKEWVGYITYDIVGYI
jgi:uncharacterized SAM-binding protein YcdF (DUF218 family)